MSNTEYRRRTHEQGLRDAVGNAAVILRKNNHPVEWEVWQVEEGGTPDKLGFVTRYEIDMVVTPGLPEPMHLLMVVERRMVWEGIERFPFLTAELVHCVEGWHQDRADERLVETLPRSTCDLLLQLREHYYADIESTFERWIRFEGLVNKPSLDSRPKLEINNPDALLLERCELAELHGVKFHMQTLHITSNGFRVANLLRKAKNEQTSIPE